MSGVSLSVLASSVSPAVKSFSQSRAEGHKEYRLSLLKRKDAECVLKMQIPEAFLNCSKLDNERNTV